jgi:hypothetical protein
MRRFLHGQFLPLVASLAVVDHSIGRTRVRLGEQAFPEGGSSVNHYIERIRLPVNLRQSGMD